MKRIIHFVLLFMFFVTGLSFGELTKKEKLKAANKVNKAHHKVHSKVRQKKRQTRRKIHHHRKNKKNETTTKDGQG